MRNDKIACRLHCFNPGHETAVLNDSPYYTPPAIRQKLQRDLALLPIWYASPADRVWMEYGAEPEDEDFVGGLPFDLPCMVDRRMLSGSDSLLHGCELALWGVSPSGLHSFGNLSKQYGGGLSVQEWNPVFRSLCNREYSAKCLAYLIEHIPGIDAGIIPDYYTAAVDVVDVMRLASQRCIVKSPYSSSGSGLLWLNPGETDRASRQLLQGMINRQSRVSLEKALDKKLDFSMQFNSDGEGNVSLQGVSLFETDIKGNYKGTRVASQSEIRQTILAALPDWKYYESLCVEHLCRFLAVHYALVYKGNIGVDMLVYEDKGRRLHPCVEINMRTTMGFVGLCLYEYFCETDFDGMFRIDHYRDTEKLLAAHQGKTAEHRAVFRNGKLLSGYFPLSPVKSDSNYTAYLELYR